jgi:hypothetical protein
LTDRSADHDLENLVLVEAARPRRCDILVADQMGLRRDLADQSA